jgi:hypothetical protein
MAAKKAIGQVLARRFPRVSEARVPKEMLEILGQADMRRVA